MDSFIYSYIDNLGDGRYYDTFENTLLDYKNEDLKIENIEYQINLINANS